MKNLFSVDDINAFLDAALDGDLGAVRRWLREGMHPDTGVNTVTALYFATTKGHVPVMQALLDAGASPNHLVKAAGALYEERSALNAAVLAQSLDGIELLLMHGANPRVLTNRDFTAAHRLLNMTQSYLELPEGEVALNKLLTRFLDLGVPVDQTDTNHRTLLHIAVSQGGPVSVVEALLDRGAYIRAANKDGLHPLHMAAQLGNHELVKLLISRGADPNTADRDGHTPLRYSRSPDVGQVLLAHGADVNARDKSGRTILSQLLDDMARSNSSNLSPSVALLLEARADLQIADYSGSLSAREVIDEYLTDPQAETVNAFIAAREARAVMKQAINRTRATATT